ncbi:MAG: hypothetical protein N2378_06865 [Chloroflexaceae bacterium]|nr:hypothetical protein [Chloroflexaceae bacterium]
MTLYLLFGLAALALIGLVALLWRLWRDYAQLSPEAEERERELALLNDAQANRMSDQVLARPLDPDAAWQTMVERGAGRRRRSPPRR